MCKQRGLSVGYLASTGHLSGGTAAEAAKKVEVARGHIDAAVLLGAPMVRIFTGPPTSDRTRQAQEVGCMQQICSSVMRAQEYTYERCRSTCITQRKSIPVFARDSTFFIRPQHQYI